MKNFRVLAGLQPSFKLENDEVAYVRSCRERLIAQNGSLTPGEAGLLDDLEKIAEEDAGFSHESGDCEPDCAFCIGVDFIEAKVEKGEKITVYFKNMISVTKVEGYMSKVNGTSGNASSVEFYKKNARKHPSHVDSYYNPWWMVVKGWGHPDPGSAWNDPETDPTTGVTTRTGKYHGASMGPVDDFLAGPGKNLKPWAMWKDKQLIADPDVPMASKKEP